jgi:polysaccharide pyruvyl transferase CsaB
MTLMGLNIGGAETHVLELCKALKRRGVDVYVASNGGVYVKELTESGVKHFNVPLHNKQLGNIFYAYAALEKIIRENNIKLVHAHARIPAFICGLLQKKLGFRFVTTVHWDFNASFPWNFLSRWGDGSLSVSEDLKKYLIDIYGVPEEQIILTINGIDTDKFSPADEDPELARELNLNPYGPRVVHVSRMDRKANRTAYKLMDAVEIARKTFPYIELIIVGGGDDEENIFRQVRHRNELAGAEYIKAVGSRTDVKRFLRSGTIFVGISRAALEAMSVGMPVILAGDPGYIGQFNEDMLDIGISTNFTCRGCPDTEARTLAEDITEILNRSVNERAALGDYARSVVREYYSVDRMSRDALALYEMVRYPRKPIDTVISGYYGFNNNGDDTVLKSVIDGLKGARPGLNITVLSMRPRETRLLYGVDSINRYNLFSVYRALRKAKMLITGGGSLIQDVTSTQSLIYYLWLINRAYKCGVRNMLYANGIGPVRQPVNIARVRNALNRVEMITLRDELSEQTLKHFGVTNPEIHVTADAAFSLNNVDEDEVQNLLAGLGLEGKRFFGVAVRKWKYNMPGFEEEIAKFADYITQSYRYTALFIPMRPVDDSEISRRIMGLMKQQAIFLGDRYTSEQLRGVVAKSEFILGMRLHTLIYAAKSGTPVIGLVYDSKIKVQMDALNQRFYRLVEDFRWEELKNYADRILADREQVIEEILEAGQRERAKALLNTGYCLEVMDRGVF